MKKILNLCSKIVVVIALCLAATSCSTLKSGGSVPLYNRDGKQVVSVVKNDLNKAAPNVTYSLRTEVWARVGDAAFSLANMAGRAAVNEYLSPKNDSKRK